jgi:hypothetical protein
MLMLTISLSGSVPACPDSECLDATASAMLRCRINIASDVSISLLTSFIANFHALRILARESGSLPMYVCLHA